MTVTGNANDSKVREIMEIDVREIIETDVRYTICDVTKPVCILLLRVLFILKHILKVQKIFARWIPHSLIDDQKRTLLLASMQLLKLIPKLNQSSKKKRYLNMAN